MNENDPHKLIYLNVWFLLGRSVWEGRRYDLGGVTKTLFEELCHIIRQTFVS